MSILGSVSFMILIGMILSTRGVDKQRGSFLVHYKYLGLVKGAIILASYY